MMYAWIAIAVLLGVAGAGYQGFRMGQDNVTAKQARDDQVRMETLQLAQQGAAEAIATMEVVNKTIYQRATREVIEKPVYRDCVHTPDGLRTVNAALGNTEIPAGDSVMPGADGTQR